MAIACPECGRQYDVTLFSFGRTVRCECGRRISAAAGHRARTGPGEGAPPLPDLRRREARRKMDELARGADRVASLILYTDLPDVDIEIAIGLLRDRAEELFPGRSWLFDMVYRARFDRLREQWGQRRGR